MLRGSRAIHGGEGKIEQKCKVDYESLSRNQKNSSTRLFD